MHWPTSAMSASSVSSPPSGSPATRRASASSWRTVPTRHGTHWPHDSSRKKAAIRWRSRGRSTVSSRTRTTPEPSVVPAARAPSNVSGTSRSSGPRKPPAAPPISTACSGRPPGTPPARSSTSRSVAPKRTSYVPGRATWPERQRSFVPVEPSVPTSANAGPEPSTTSSTLTSVSTLFTTVGFPKRPTSTGNGGLLRGSPRLPSIDSKIAVSSPQMYAPAPRRISTSKAKPSPMTFVAEEPASAGLRERVLERVQRLRVLPAEVEVAPLAAGRVGGDGHRLDHRERIALHQLAVLERPRLGLVRVADEVVRAGRLPCDRLPLDARSGTRHRRDRPASSPSPPAARPPGRARTRGAARRSRRARGSRRCSPGRRRRRGAGAAATRRPPVAAARRATAPARRRRGGRAPPRP